MRWIRVVSRVIRTFEQTEHANKVRALRKIPEEDESEILRWFLEGDTYREIVKKTEFRYSISTVNRVINDARKGLPDLDSLRSLTLSLKKHGGNVFDAIRGSNLLERLNTCGISLQQLEGYIQLTERFLSDKTLGEDFMSYAIKLMQLEQTYGKQYKEIVEDFEEKRKEAVEYEKRKTYAEAKLRALKVKIRKIKKNLAELTSEIERATTAHKGLSALGVDKLAKLAKFIHEFESLGFNARELVRLARALRELKKIYLDLDKLENFINLRLANENLKKENTTLMGNNADLRQRNSALVKLDEAWENGTFIVDCPLCNEPLRIFFRSREYYQDQIDSQQSLRYSCPNCGKDIVFAPKDIIFLIGWNLIPLQEETPEQ